jgi:hypothetical protein
VSTRRGLALRAVLACALSLASGAANGARAQQVDSARIGISPQSDSARALVAPERLRTAADSLSDRRDSVLLAGPPIRPKTALFRSLLVPGWGQASLDRGTAGATYFAIEAGSIAMLLFAKKELAVAKRAARDSTFANDTVGPPPELAGRVRVRSLQVEDWAALIFFNHLFSAADAFVSAHLWDVRVQVHGGQEMRSAGVSATIPW